jgi:AcrR family transcriptional regulator
MEDRTAALLWQPQAMPKRGPRPTLTLAAIAAAGIAVTDAQGLPALTMQGVAQRLGVTKMALYRYVPGKAELVALMIEVGLGAPPPARPGDWRAALDGWARALFERFQAHPWSIEATIGVRVMGPNELGWLDYALTAMDGTGLTGTERLDVAVTLLGHVRNLAQQVGALSARPEQAEQVLESSLAVLVRGREERFPGVAAALASTAVEGAQNQGLGFGLDLILEGAARLVTERSGG